IDNKAHLAASKKLSTAGCEVNSLQRTLANTKAGGFLRVLDSILLAIGLFAQQLCCDCLTKLARLVFVQLCSSDLKKIGVGLRKLFLHCRIRLREVCRDFISSREDSFEALFERCIAGVVAQLSEPVEKLRRLLRRTGIVISIGLIARHAEATQEIRHPQDALWAAACRLRLGGDQ